jgi:hypothetical protein
MPGVFVQFTGPLILERLQKVGGRVQKLLEVLTGKPTRAPHQIGSLVVSTITIQVDGGIERVERMGGEERFGDQEGDRPLVLNSVSGQTDIDDPTLVDEEREDITRLIVSNATSVADRVTRELVNETPVFHEGVVLLAMGSCVGVVKNENFRDFLLCCVHPGI